MLLWCVANSALEAAKNPVLPGAAAAPIDSALNSKLADAAKARIDEVARTIYVGNISLSLTEDHLRTV